MTFELGKIHETPEPPRETQGARALPMVKTKRKCGSCRACCTALAVPDLSDAFEKCPNETPKKKGKKGCKVYADRPDPCRAYQCYWLMGMGQWTDRPDKVGIIVDSSEDFQRAWGTLGVMVREVFPGAAKTKRAAHLIDRMSGGVVVIIRADGTRGFVSADPAAQAQFAAIMQRAHVEPAHDFREDFSEEG